MAIEAARVKLANIVINFAKEEEQDDQKLKDRAVRILSVDNA